MMKESMTTTTTGRDWSDAWQALAQVQQLSRPWPPVAVGPVRVAKALALARDLDAGGWLTERELLQCTGLSKLRMQLSLYGLPGMLSIYAPGWTVTREPGEGWSEGPQGRGRSRWRYRLEWKGVRE